MLYAGDIQPIKEAVRVRYTLGKHDSLHQRWDKSELPSSTEYGVGSLEPT